MPGQEKGTPGCVQPHPPSSSHSPLPLSPEPGEGTGKFPFLPVKGRHPIFFKLYFRSGCAQDQHTCDFFENAVVRNRGHSPNPQEF